jgi:hypothetical protein
MGMDGIRAIIDQIYLLIVTFAPQCHLIACVNRRSRIGI